MSTPVTRFDHDCGPSLADSDRLELMPAERSMDRFLAGFNIESSSDPILTTADPAEIRNILPVEPPEGGCALADVVDELAATAGRFRRRNDHPGFHAWIASPGLPTDPLAHALTATLNQNLTGFHSAPGAAVIEQTLLGWIAGLAGLPDTAGGLVLSGGSMANISALSVATYNKLGDVAIRHGIAAGPRPVILAADNVHFSVCRAAVMLGIGLNGIESIPVDMSQRMRTDILEERLAAISRENERVAVCVVASAGSTATGSIDPLEDIARLCRHHDVWMHVDAAYGGAALLSEDLRPRLRGMEHADSISIDLHKWAYLAFEGSVLLYRDPSRARRLFAVNSSYAHFDETDCPDGPMFINLSPEVSRRARAIPAWMALRYHGLGRIGRNIRHNADCAAWLAALVENAPDMELVAAPDLSICCFRYAPQALHEQETVIDDLNEAIQEQLNAGGEYLLSPTKVHDRPVMRVCICSHRTRAEHMVQLLSRIRSLGEALLLRQ